MFKAYLSPRNLCFAFCLLLFIIRLFIASNTGLGVDESYNARGALNVRAGYIDHPPLFFWLSHLSVKIFGFTRIGLRLPAIVLFAGTSLLVFYTARRLFSEWAGLFAVVFLNLSFIFTLPVAVWFQPDAPLMFFWMLSVWLAVKLFFQVKPLTETQKYLYWSLLGISIGLATLSKYHAVFLVAGLFIFMLARREFRMWFKHPAPYLAFILFVATISPLLIWNSQNGWISFSLQFSRALPGNKLSFHPEWLLRNIIGQAIWLFPWIWWWLIKQLFRTTSKIRHSTKHAFLFWLAVIPILFFTLITLWADTQYRFHWQAPGYLVLFIPLGHYFAWQWFNQPAKLKRKIVAGSLLLTILAGVLIGHMNTGFWQFYGPGQITKMTGGSFDPTLEGFDFDEIRERFENEGWLADPDVFAGGVRWWQAGKTDWALRCQKEMVVFDRNISNYNLYQKPRSLLGKDAVIVRFPEQNEPRLKQYFDSVTRLENIDIVRGGRTELSLDVFYCKNFKMPDKGEKDYLFTPGLYPFN
jgi:hypothetical protein